MTVDLNKLEILALSVETETNLTRLADAKTIFDRHANPATILELVKMVRKADDAILAAEARGYERAKEQAAKVADFHHEQDEIDNGVAMTGASGSAAEAIRNMKDKTDE